MTEDDASSRLYFRHEADEIVLVYQQFRSVLSQLPAGRRFCRCPRIEGGERPGNIFEPDAESVLNSLVELYISNSVYSVLLEAKAGEHSARMTAMTAATDNTDWSLYPRSLWSLTMQDSPPSPPRYPRSWAAARCSNGSSLIAKRRKKESMVNGIVKRVIGPVVDVQFPAGELPELYNAVEIKQRGR